MTARHHCLLVLSAALLACAARRTPEQLALLARGDCRELLSAADAARAKGDKRLAGELASACKQAGLEGLVDQAKTPVEAMLWCGRARVALPRQATAPTCSAELVLRLTAEIKPRLTLGPADPEATPDPFLRIALEAVGAELKLAYDHGDPMVTVGRIIVTVDRSESETLARASDPSGARRNVPAVLHRIQVRAEAQVALGTRVRTLHANEESRDATWAGEPRFAIAARFKPELTPEEELKKRAVIALLRNIARALRVSPPENLEPADPEGCMAYGIALAVATGNRGAAASGVGEDDKIEGCERILGLRAGAGIPVP